MDMNFPHSRHAVRATNQRCNYAALVALAAQKQTHSRTALLMMQHSPDIESEANAKDVDTITDRISYFANKYRRHSNKISGAFFPEAINDENRMIKKNIQSINQSDLANRKITEGNDHVSDIKFEPQQHMRGKEI